MQMKTTYNMQEADVIFARDNAERNNLLKECAERCFESRLLSQCWRIVRLPELSCADGRRQVFIVRGDARSRQIVHRDWAHTVAFLVERFTGCQHYWMQQGAAKDKLPLRLHFFGIGANTRLAAHAFVFVHNSIARWSMTEVDTLGHTNVEARRAKKCVAAEFTAPTLPSYWRNGCASRIRTMVDNELEDEKRRAARNERDIRLGKIKPGRADVAVDMEPDVALTEAEVDILADQPLHNEAPAAKGPDEWTSTKWLICVREREQTVAKVRGPTVTRPDMPHRRTTPQRTTSRSARCATLRRSTSRLSACGTPTRPAKTMPRPTSTCRRSVAMRRSRSIPMRKSSASPFVVLYILMEAHLSLDMRTMRQGNATIGADYSFARVAEPTTGI